jgi:glycosyltransferase involved in cell wall biosynthesis
MRVVHVITTLTTGGAERQLELLMNHSAHHSAVIALYDGGAVADSLRVAGHPVEVLGMAGWRKPLAWFRLALALRRYRPDVVHVHLLAAQLWGIPAARLAGVKVVISSEHSLMDDTTEGRPLSPWLRRRYRVLERLSTHTVAVSGTTAERLRRWGVPAERISVVENGIDFAAFRFADADRAAVRAELGIGPDVRVIGAVGRLETVKRLDQLLRAGAPRLRAGGHALIVAGAGELLDSLQKLSSELGVADTVRWLGARPDVPRVLAAMDVLVSPSRDETFGLAVIEGLAGGLPVVYAQCPALDDLDEADDGAGAPPWALRIASSGLSDEAEVRELAGALEATLDTPPARPADLESGEGVARYRVPAGLQRRFGVAGTAAALDELYRRMTERVR